MIKGPTLFDMDSGTNSESFKPTQHFTMIFNAFVLMTLFNEINSRKIHGERNVFEGFFSNPIFYGIWIVTLCLQVKIKLCLKNIRISTRRSSAQPWAFIDFYFFLLLVSRNIMIMPPWDKNNSQFYL